MPLIDLVLRNQRWTDTPENFDVFQFETTIYALSYCLSILMCPSIE